MHTYRLSLLEPIKRILIYLNMYYHPLFFLYLPSRNRNLKILVYYVFIFVAKSLFLENGKHKMLKQPNSRTRGPCKERMTTYNQNKQPDPNKTSEHDIIQNL